MASQIKTENQDPFSERAEEREGKHFDSTDIMEAYQAFEQLINIFETKKVQLKLEDVLEIYSIQVYHIGGLTNQSVKVIYEEIMGRYKNSKVKRNWYENQLRIFVWVLFNYSEAKRKPIQKFEEEEWELIAKAFVGKAVEDIKFQWLLLSKSTCVSVPWTQEEDDLLEKLMSQQDYQNRWIDIARILYQNSNSGHFRKPKQCRQRWKNYLNPTIQKGEWNLEEDKKLLELILRLGKKWSTISKTLETRTQHTVKNRYKSLLKKYKKDHSIREKPKSAKGLHMKEVQQINEMLEQIKQKISLKSLAFEAGKQKQQQNTTREQPGLDRFYPISPNSAWKYCDKAFPTILTVIQSPRVISPRVMSPAFCFQMAAWSQDNNKLFYS